MSDYTELRAQAQEAVDAKLLFRANATPKETENG